MPPKICEHHNDSSYVKTALGEECINCHLLRTTIERIDAPDTFITREQALTFIMQHQRLAERDFLAFAKQVFIRHGGKIPPAIRAKFLQAGDQYGPFRLNDEWIEHMESEVWDGMLYAGLTRLKREMMDDAVLVPDLENKHDPCEGLPFSEVHLEQLSSD